MIYLKKILVDYSIQNIDGLIEKKNINATKNKFIEFIDDNESYKIKLDKSITVEKENKESIIKFNFEENKSTKVYYYIKELDIEIDAEIHTKKINKENNEVTIEYDLILSGEKSGNFIYKIKIKEE